MKFRLKIGKGSVQEFTDAAGVVYKPGEVVDLPSSYEGEVWLERVDPVPVVAAVPGKIEPVAVSSSLLLWSLLWSLSRPNPRGRELESCLGSSEENKSTSRHSQPKSP